MKLLGYFSGFAVALAIWAATFFLVTWAVDLVPLEKRDWAGLAGLICFGAGALAGRHAWKATCARFDQAAVDARRRKAKQQAETQRLRREESQRLADQRLLEFNLQRRLESARAVAAQLGVLVANAERLIDEAEHEFVGNLYVPYWDAIEHVVTELATYHAHVQMLIRTALHYQKDAKRLPSAPPRFTLTIEALPEVVRTSERLCAVVRWSHGSREFSSIYEMRKNDFIDVPGFGPLGETLAELTLRLTECNTELSALVCGRAAVGSAKDGPRLNAGDGVDFLRQMLEHDEPNALKAESFAVNHRVRRLWA